MGPTGVSEGLGSFNPKGFLCFLLSDLIDEELVGASKA